MNGDPRHILNGWEIPTENYSDQPYVVRTDDGAWLCVLTTGAGFEGEAGQHVVSFRSLDRGRHWIGPVDVEPTDGPEASYAVMLKAPGGRIFCFYNHNTDNLRRVKADDPPVSGGYWSRVDSQGHYVFKYSDDGGKSWSARRVEIPQRLFRIDRENPYGGAVRFFWNVGRPFLLRGEVYVTLHKIGRFGEGAYASSQGALLHSPDLLYAPSPEDAHWETLPDGDEGLCAPAGGGPIAEEQCCLPMSDGGFFCVYRTVDGHPACAYSRDGGHTFGAPEYMRFANGRLMKHPRAANFVWRLRDGKYLYWFHNHGGQGYEDRNPVWLSCGTEYEAADGRRIAWSEPEILLYDDDANVRISYPDMIEEDDGSIYFTETQKDKARVHLADRALIDGLRAQSLPGAPGGEPLLSQSAPGARLRMPTLPRFVVTDAHAPDLRSLDLRAGFSVYLSLRSAASGALLDAMSAAGRGVRLWIDEAGRVCFEMSDVGMRVLAMSDRLDAGAAHRVCVIADGGPKVILSVADGRLSDGEERQFGWARFGLAIRDVNGAGEALVGAQVAEIIIYGRALRVSEAVWLTREPKREGENG